MLAMVKLASGQFKNLNVEQLGKIIRLWYPNSHS